MALPGGYGGMVIADQGLATLACCLRRDTLSLCRTIQPRRPVGDAVESYLREGCVGVREALEGAQRAGPWLAVGPLLSGVQRPAAGALFSVGNAAGETHPWLARASAWHCNQPLCWLMNSHASPRR